MGYSLSAEEAKKREKYVAKVRELHERFKKFGIDYLPGDRSKVYKPILVFPEYVGKNNYKIYLFITMGIMKAVKIAKAMEDAIVSREELKKYVMRNGANFLNEMPIEERK
jgi:hypothetical protein